MEPRTRFGGESSVVAAVSVVSVVSVVLMVASHQRERPRAGANRRRPDGPTPIAVA